MSTSFPPGFFARQDEHDDADFYRPVRLVTHIDDGAIAAVGRFYEHLDLGRQILDVCGSWVSHFAERPEELTVLGMNAEVNHSPNPMVGFAGIDCPTPPVAAA